MRRVTAMSLKKKPTRVFPGCSAARWQLCSLCRPGVMGAKAGMGRVNQMTWLNGR